MGELARGWMVLLYTVLILLNGSMLVYLYCCTVAILLICRFSRFLILLNCTMLLYLYCCAVTVLLYLLVLSVLQSCRITLAGQRDDCLCCCCLVESSGWASIRVLVDHRHGVRKCDEIMNSRHNELSVFIRITFSTYSSTAVPMHEMMAILG